MAAKAIMIYGDFCTGIAAASVAWKPLGWRPAFFSEIEPFPCKLLKHHYPDVPNLGDMTKIQTNKIFNESIVDLFVAGTPCQSFSLAGLRAGLDSANGNLALQYCKLLIAKQPKWFVWENVPGVFSSFSNETGSPDIQRTGFENGGDITETSDFATILTAFSECGYSCTYRVFDSQYFGVPQRRRRVFVVGYLADDWRPSAAVLLDPESLRGNIAKGGKKKKDVAGTINAGSSRSRGAGTDPGAVVSSLTSNGVGTCGADDNKAQAGHLQPYNVSFNDANGRRKDRPNGGLYINETEVSNVVNTGGVGDTLIAGSFWDGSQTTQTLDAVLHKGQMMPEKNRFPVVLQPMILNDQGGSSINVEKGNVSPSLRSESHNHKPVIFQPKASVSQGIQLSDKSPSLGSTKTPGILSTTVRRLTPMECERLQGFPDSYTNIPGASDSARYKALGNSMTTNVMAYIGKRIDLVDKVLKGEL